MSGYQDMRVWQASHSLTLEIYKLTDGFPSEEKYGLVSQMRRAAYSVPSNIAEGKALRSQADFKRYLIIAMGSANELSYFLLLSKDLGFISGEKYEILVDRCNHVAAMLNKLISAVKK